jgi:FixJ family two-component response regulator
MDTNFPWVAVIDDEPAIRRALVRLLRASGITAREFDGGAALLATLSQGPAPYCVVLDLHMPGMSGLELQEHLLDLAPRTGVITVTGHHSPETQARALRSNPVAYLHKPMNDLLLLEAIAAARAKWIEQQP